MLFAIQFRQHGKRWWLILLTAISISSLIVIGARAKNTPPNSFSAKESHSNFSDLRRSALRTEAVSLVQLNADSYSVGEGDGTAQIVVDLQSLILDD